MNGFTFPHTLYYLVLIGVVRPASEPTLQLGRLVLHVLVYIWQVRPLLAILAAGRKIATQ